MRFNRRLKSFSAISFDLDDTLYNNTPVMLATDEKMVSYFTEKLPQLHSGTYNYYFWFTFREQVLQQQPALEHDVGELRLQSYCLGLISLGFEKQTAKQMAKEALAYFVEERSNFSVPQSIHQLLSKLKQRWPLVAISNGNVDTSKIGLDDYFVEVYHAGNGLKQKPSKDMFQVACQKLALSPQAVLHVGDCGRSDVYGAIKSGCQSAWLSCYQVGKPISILPTIELSDIVELQGLL